MQALVNQPATPLESVPDLGESVIEKLSAAGVTTVEALADMTPEQLEADREVSVRRQWKKSVLRSIITFPAWSHGEKPQEGVRGRGPACEAETWK